MKRLATLLAATLAAAAMAFAQDEVPTIDPQGAFSDAEGKEETGITFSGSAPVIAHFEANPQNVGSWSENYEWRFTLQQEGSTDSEPYLVRYERDTDYTFTQTGTHKIVCYATFTLGNDTIAYTQDYYQGEGTIITINIGESKLEMPNAFTPNGDNKNELFQAKKGYKSIVEFKAVIYNRWGQKLYEWDDPSEGKGWDGKYNGKDCKQGVYFVEVKAKGGDGKNYHIKRDVNLLRDHRERESSTSTTP